MPQPELKNVPLAPERPEGEPAPLTGSGDVDVDCEGGLAEGELGGGEPVSGGALLGAALASGAALATRVAAACAEATRPAALPEALE